MSGYSSKRARSSVAAVTKPAKDSLFAAFRSLGHISTSTPFAIQSRSGKFLETPAVTVLTSLGTSWALWEGQSLRLLFVGPEMGYPISSVGFSLDSIFAAAGPAITRYVRGKQVNYFILNNNTTSSSSSSASSSSSSSSSSSASSDSDSESDSDTDDDSTSTSPASTVLTNLTLFGTTLIAFSASGRQMHIWDVPPLVNPASVDPHTPDQPEASTSTATVAPVAAAAVTPYLTVEFPSGFTASTVVHPSSYLNKVVVGSKEGELAVWNVRTGTCLHTFPASALVSVSAASPVTFLEQSPALDVLGVGLASGVVVLFDVRMGEVLGKVRLEGDGVGEVAGLSFRNDDNAQTLAVSSTAGHIALFDLSNKLRLLHLVRAVHDGPVGGIQWVPGQPLLMTSGGDNSVKQWLFESPSAAPRLLKQRSGHHAPPHLVRYYGDDGKAVLTAGADRALRYTSIVRDSRGFELSQGAIQKKANHLGVKPSSLKLPVITSIAYSTSRSKEWDDLVTTSAGESLGRSWSVENKRTGNFTLPAGGVATASCVSACGNFGLVGSASGDVVMHNMQSGLKRKVFKVPAGVDSNPKAVHVTGVATDSLNRVAIVSTLRGGLHLFDFQTMKLRKSLPLPANITSIHLHRDNNLLAVTCDDLIVRIVDIETQKVVRELFGAKGRILDLAFSPDGRWVITTSQDAVIRTFDVPTGQLVDAFRTPSVATSLSFSPTGDFLATAHVDSVGVYLWANRAQFTDVSLRSFVESDLEDVALPTVQGVDAHEGLTELKAPTKWEDVQPYTTPDQLAEELLTLSLMPRTRWQTLLNLDTIKQRNKPKEAPKAPERAPFFLPTLPGVKQRFDFGIQDSEVKGVGEGAGSRKLDMSAASVETEFIRRMMNEKEDGDYGAFFEYLKALSPSATDLELRSLSTLPHLSLFLQALAGRLRSHRDFEAVQTFLALFLRVHGDVLVQNTELGEGLREVRREQEREVGRLQELCHKAIGTLAFLRGAPVV